MEFVVIQNKVKDIPQLFAKSLLNMDRDTLWNLLDENGEFEIQGNTFETISVSKVKFINWILSERIKEVNLDFIFDQCTHCRIGNPVVIFNGGSFPRKTKGNSEKSKTGLMFEINENHIEGISFCHSFIATDNPCIYEIEIESDINKYMRKKGCTRKQAEHDYIDNYGILPGSE